MGEGDAAKGWATILHTFGSFFLFFNIGNIIKNILNIIVPFLIIHEASGTGFESHNNMNVSCLTSKQSNRPNYDRKIFGIHVLLLTILQKFPRMKSGRKASP